MSDERLVIDKSTLTGIADAIRTKEGSSAEIPVPELKFRILDIQTGADISNLDGYTELPYVTITSTSQYINTGFYPKYNTRVVMDIEGLGSSESWIMGAKNENKPLTSKQFALYRSTTAIRFDYFGYNTSLDISASNASKRTTIDMNANVATMFGQTLTNTKVSSGTVGYPLAIFTSNAGVDGVRSSASYKLYSCQIYDGSTLAHDFVPMTSPSGLDGVYDRVDKTFHDINGNIADTTALIITLDGNGLITASMGSKVATKQLRTKAGTTITPSSSVQTAIPAGTYATGDIRVAAVSSSGGKQVFTGTVNVTGFKSSLSISTGGPSSSSWSFYMSYTGNGHDGLYGQFSNPVITSAVKGVNVGTINRIAVSEAGHIVYDDGTCFCAPCVSTYESRITYSAGTITIASPVTSYGFALGTYLWCLIIG